MRAIAVDDDRILLTVLEGLLPLAGVKNVRTFSNAEDALKAVSQDPSGDVDIAFIDLNMPDVDGFALLRGLADAGFKGAVAVVSGEKAALRNSAEHISAKLGLRFAGTIAKPPRLDDIRKILANAAPNEAYKADILSGSVPADSEEKRRLHYQPQVDCAADRVIGAEALLRLIDDENRIYGPEEYLRRFSSRDDRFNMTTSLFDMFTADIRKMTDSGFQGSFGFNIDASVLEMPETAPMIRHYTQARDIEPSTVKIELTESHLPSDPARMLEIIARLSMQGFVMALDDFGTGSSNFALLHEGAFDEVKLDKSIMRSAMRGTEARGFVKSVVSIAHTMELALIAEGVETADDRDAVLDLGITKMQGYYFSPALCCQRLVEFQHNFADRPVALLRANDRKQQI